MAAAIAVGTRRRNHDIKKSLYDARIAAELAFPQLTPCHERACRAAAPLLEAVAGYFMQTRVHMSTIWPEDRDFIHQVGHRASVGGRWDEIGRLQFEYLVSQGLKPTDVLVDVGCGSLRGGVHFIRYLDPGHYFGVDKHIEHIIYGVALELGFDAYKDKLPRFYANDSFDFSRFDQTPNYGIAQSLFTHLEAADIVRCLERLKDFVAPHFQLFGTFNEAMEPKGFQGESHAHRVFHFTRDEIADMAKQAGWGFGYIGGWGHPRGQHIARFMPAGDVGLHSLEAPFPQQNGWCWAKRLPPEIAELGDSNSNPKSSPLRLFQDSKELAPAHAPHREIREKGGGSYSFWGSTLYFSTPDGSDPNQGGHAFRVMHPIAAAGKPREPAPPCKGAIVLLGTSYCGSSLVNAVLDSHSQIAGGGELHWLVSKHARGLCAICGEDCKLWTPEVRQTITAENVWDTCATLTKKSFVLDTSKMKNWFIDFLPKVKQERIVTVMGKHPIRLASSFLEKARRREDMKQYRDIDVLMERIASSYKFIFDSFKIEFLLRYEDFVKSPEKSLDSILKNFDLSFEQSMSNWQKDQHHYIGGNPGPRFQLHRDLVPDTDFIRSKYEQDGVFLDDSYLQVLSEAEITQISSSDGAKYMCDRFEYDMNLNR